MNYFLVEIYFETLANISRLNGVHNYQLTESGSLIYRPSTGLLCFFIEALGKISNLGFDRRQIAERLNTLDVFNILQAEIAPWDDEDISLIINIGLLGSENRKGLIFDNQKKGEDYGCSRL